MAAAASGLCLQGALARFDARAGGFAAGHDSTGAFFGGDWRSLTGNGLANGRGFLLPPDLPAPWGRPIAPGETWCFQLWSPGGSGAGFSSALAIGF